VFESLKSRFNTVVTKITTTELKAEELRPILESFKLGLIENDVAVAVADHICVAMEKRLNGVQVKRLEDRKNITKANLSKILLEILTVGNEVNLLRDVERKGKANEPYIILFVGINGTGKTTSIAKVARFFMKNGYSVVLAGSDTYRPGSIEQLEVHAKRLGVRVIKHKYGADPASVAYDAISYASARGINVVLVDTAGRIQTDRNLMNELKKIKRIINPDLTLLIVDALTGNDAVMQAEEFHRTVGIDGTVLTKVDADVKGGAALSVTYTTRKPIVFIGTGQNYKDLQNFNPERFTKLILH
jgi:fused signal recognition particle receptor